MSLALTAIPARAATQVPPEMQNVPDEKKAIVTQERAWRLQKEQAAGALLADQHQKAFRRAVMAGVKARAQQRAVEISRQLASTEAVAQPAAGSTGILLGGIALLLAGIFFFHWRRRARPA